MTRTLLTAIAILMLFATTSYGDETPSSARLKVPLVKQGRGALCGPACMEMVFRYWGVRGFDQHDLATAILHRYPDLPRVKKSGVLNDSRIDWRKYPGTGTSTMRKFLAAYAKTENPKIKQLPTDQDEAVKEATKIFVALKAAVANGVPVIVHQYWKGPGSTQHYRVVTGFNDKRKMIYLNDPQLGAIKQRYDVFYKLWNVNEDWLHFNCIIFNVDKDDLKLESLEVQATPGS